LGRIEQATGVRRETAGAYLKVAGIGVRPPRAWGRRPPAKPANEVTTHSATLIYNQLELSHFQILLQEVKTHVAAFKPVAAEKVVPASFHVGGIRSSLSLSNKTRGASFKVSKQPTTHGSSNVQEGQKERRIPAI
jgi:hypothetical protein